MVPTTKSRKRKASSPDPQVEAYSESEDEWEQERTSKAASSSSRQWQNDDDDDEAVDEDDEEGENGGGYAQFESDEGEEEVSEEEDEGVALGKELQTIPFGSLLKAKKKLSKAQKLQEGSDSDEEDEDENGPGGKNRKGKTEFGVKVKRGSNGRPLKKDRSSKHAPMEMSSKKAVSRTRVIVETSTKKARDPRFDSLSGSFKPSLFTSSYAFLADQQKTELETLRKTAKDARKSVILPEEEKEKIEAALRRMESRDVSRRTKEREGVALKEWKKEEGKKREEGKKEFWLKKSDQKAVLLKSKFDALATDKKQLRKSVEKKRRKIAQKDKKLIPRERVGGSGGGF